MLIYDEKNWSCQDSNPRPLDEAICYSEQNKFIVSTDLKLLSQSIEVQYTVFTVSVAVDAYAFKFDRSKKNF